jgi:hypothetical protein
MRHIEGLIETWWKPFHRFNETERPKLAKRVQNKSIVDALLNASDMLEVDTDELKQLMKLLLPKKASDGENISYFNDYNKYAAGQKKHRTKTSPGKFFLKLFPTASNKLVEAFVEFYQNKIIFDADDYVLHVGNTKEDFKRAFTNHCETKGSFTFNGSSVSISDSCMRYKFSQFDNHPSVVYASGDFQVATIRTKGGKTRARVLIGVKGGVYMPNRIYASCNYSDQLLKVYLTGLNTARQDWTGLKLLKIPTNANSTVSTNYFLCPYIDNSRDVCIYDKDYLILHHNEYEAVNQPSGYVYYSNADYKKYWVSNL